MSDEDYTLPHMTRIPLHRVRKLPSTNHNNHFHRTKQPETESLYVRQANHPQEPSQEIRPDLKHVVDYYLKQAVKHERESWLAPEKLCPCCIDVNRVNIQNMKDAGKKKPEEKTFAPQPPVKGDRHAHSPPHQKRVHFGLIHRSPTPDLTGNDYGELPHGPLPKKVFLTHPSQDVLLSEWKLEHERYQYKKDRAIAEDVVEASSNLTKSLNKLQDYI